MKTFFSLLIEFFYWVGGLCLIGTTTSWWAALGVYFLICAYNAHLKRLEQKRDHAARYKTYFGSAE